MLTESHGLEGIFSCAAPTPDAVRLWLQVARNALGWTIAEAAGNADVDLADLRRLEESGEALNEDDDDVLCAVAYQYQQAIDARVGHRHAATEHLRHMSDVLRGDANFPLARFLRARRAELGLTLEQVVERAAGQITVEQLRGGEWDGTASLDDYDGDLRAAAKGLDVPFFALRLLAEITIKEADVDEWIDWRAAQRKPAKARRSG